MNSEKMPSPVGNTKISQVIHELYYTCSSRDIIVIQKLDRNRSTIFQGWKKWNELANPRSGITFMLYHKLDYVLLTGVSRFVSG
jgi:hypothetical protein